MITKINTEYEVFSEVTDKLSQVAQQLEAHGSNGEGDAKAINKLIADFQSKIDEFNRKDRQLNIGIMGQVKAGKSSFLNTFLFNGKNILPKASTPKTATLTKIEYGEENMLTIEYYSKADWAGIEENAKVEDSDGQTVAARELVRMALENGIEKERCFTLGKETVNFTSDEELFNRLNDYVGEDGKYTPLVKAVSIAVNREEFKGLSIVDTPGLNDPIQSRTLRTKEFMKYCDVVFFLSQTSNFLDKSDWDLLSTQLPSEGVKRLILIGSKYDSGIRDMLSKTAKDDQFGPDLNKSDNLIGANELAGKKLRRRAKEALKSFSTELEKYGAPDKVLAVIGSIEKPILFSTMIHNMIGKTRDELGTESLGVYDMLNQYSDDLNHDLRTIDTFDEVVAVFGNVKAEKEAILEEKARSFVPDAMQQLKMLLTDALERTENRRNVLTSNDQAKILEKKNVLERQLNDIKADIKTVFTDLCVSVEQRKMEIASQARSKRTDHNDLKEHTGTTTEVRYHTVSDSTWYKPWTWGRTREVEVTYERQYKYFLAADAVENLSNYATDISRSIDQAFASLVDIQVMKRRLGELVRNNFDLGSESYDAALIKNIISETVGAIEFPVFMLDITSEMEALGSQFSGEITSADEITKLRTLLDKAFSKTIQIILEGVQRETRAFKEKLTESGKFVQEQLIKNLEDEFNQLQKDFENKVEVIHQYEVYEEVLKTEMQNVRG